MKKRVAAFALAVFALHANAQKTLRDVIRTDKGITKRFATVKQDNAMPFNPSAASATLGLQDGSNLTLIKTETDKLGMQHYRYYQTYQGIPVENSMYVVHTNNGKLVSMSGEIVTDFVPAAMQNKSSKITAEQAIDAVLKKVNAQVYAWQDKDMERSLQEQKQNKNATYAPVAKLVWYNSGDAIKPAELRLAYKIDVYARMPLSRAYYFIDASSGELLGQKDILNFSDATGTASTAYSGSQTIHSDYTGTNYRLRDITKGGGIITLHGESGQRGTNYTSSSANWVLTGTNIAALDAHYGVSQTYAFYFDNFGRNSYDNAGTALTSYVNDPTYIDNAFWDGSAMNFNKRSNSAANPGGVTGIDVTGHELTHGVTQETCGLVYSNESGAINESLSDIMGKSVQFWSKPSDIVWEMSNDMNWIIRNMSNPNAAGDPDTYQGTNWYTGSVQSTYVHTNSGVGNYMFYLLVTGGSGTNDNGDAYTVTGLGLSKADQIIYRSQTVYLTSNSNYSDWRAACITAATDLYGTGSAEVTQVGNAFSAVGVGGGGGGNCASEYDTNSNDGFASAVAIPLSTDVKGTIGNSTDNDYYAITASGAGVITISLTTVPADYDVKLYNGSQTQVAVSENGGTSNESITYNAPAAGTYYIRLYGYNGANSSSCYTLKATFTAGGGTCPSSYDNVSNDNFSKAQQIPLNTDIKGKISPSTDKDVYKFTITNGGTITVSLTNLPADYDIKLFNASQTQVGVSQNSGTTSETINYTASSGTYYVRVYGYNGANSSTVCYNLKVQTGTASFAGTPVVSLHTGIRIFPNPVNEILQVNLDKIAPGSYIKIFDLNGRNMISKNVSETNIGINVKTLNAGFYMLKVYDNNREEQYSIKFLKQ